MTKTMLPVDIDIAKNDPVLVPLTQSNKLYSGCFVIDSSAMSISVRINPLIPPPSSVRTASLPVFSFRIDWVRSSEEDRKPGTSRSGKSNKNSNVYNSFFTVFPTVL